MSDLCFIKYTNDAYFDNSSSVIGWSLNNHGAVSFIIGGFLDKISISLIRINYFDEIYIIDLNAVSSILFAKRSITINLLDPRSTVIKIDANAEDEGDILRNEFLNFYTKWKNYKQEQQELLGRVVGYDE